MTSQARNAAPAVASLQARSYADKASPTEVSSILEQRIRGVQEESNLAETGRVLSIGYVLPSKLGRWLGASTSNNHPRQTITIVICDINNHNNNHRRDEHNFWLWDAYVVNFLTWGL